MMMMIASQSMKRIADMRWTSFLEFVTATACAMWWWEFQMQYIVTNGLSDGLIVIVV